MKIGYLPSHISFLCSLLSSVFHVIINSEFELAHELEVIRMIDTEVVHVLLYTKLEGWPLYRGNKPSNIPTL